MAILVQSEQTKTLTDRLDILDKIAAQINKKCGKIMVGRIGANQEIMSRLKIDFIPTPCDELNKATGGGFPRRRCTIISGKEDSGKTSAALETIGYNMQRDPDFVAIWLESENSLKEDYVVNTFHIDPNRFFYMDVSTQTNAEETLDRLYSIIGAHVADICVINSLKCLIPTAEREASLTKSVIALQARLNARLSRRFTALIAEHDIAFVIIQHLSVDINSMARDPLVLSGGHAIRYWASLWIDLRKLSMSDNEPIDKTEGMKISCTIRKNHCVPERNPYMKFVYYVVFGEGTEQYLSALERACNLGVAACKGAWVYWYNANGEVKEKWNGRLNYRQFMRDHPEIFTEFKNVIGGSVETLSSEEIDEIKAEEKIIEDNTQKIADELEKADKPEKKKPAKSPVKIQ